MIKVGRAINGISINGQEWLLTEDNEIMIFKNKEKAIEFLRLKGYDKLSIIEIEETFCFQEVTS